MRRVSILVPLLALAGVPAPTAQPAAAAEIVVTTTDDEFDTSGACSLREALRAANFDFRVGPCASGSETETDRIVLDDGATYLLTRAGTIDFLTGDLDVRDDAADLDVVIEVADGGTATIEQSANDRVLQVHAGAKAELHGVTLKRGRSLPAQGPFGSEPLGHGGGIANAGTLTLVRCAVVENAAESKGGGIFNGPAGASLTLVDTEVGRNLVANPVPAAPARGGGVFNQAGSSLTVDGGRIFQNSANEGGGIYNDQEAETILLDGVVVGSTSSFSANTAAVHGGGIYNDSGGTVIVSSSFVSSNSSVRDGGGLYNRGEVALVSSVVENNSAGFVGGGVRNEGTLLADASRFSGNQAQLDGGAVFNAGSLTLENGCVADGNKAGDEGGAILNARMLTLDSTRVAFNLAGSSGGGIAHAPGLGTTVTATSSVFRANRAPAGGAVLSRNGSSGSFALTSSCLLGNADVALDGTLVSPQIATGNWWGDASGPGGVGPGSGDTVDVNFDFSGFLTTAPPGCGDELMRNGDFQADAGEDGVPASWTTNQAELASPDGQICGGTGGDCALRLAGDGRNKKLVQKVVRRGAAGDTFTFSARSRASQISPDGGAYLAVVKIKYVDGTSEAFRLRFAPHTHDEQVLSRTFTARARYRALRVILRLDKPSGSVLIDDVSLIGEPAR